MKPKKFLRIYLITSFLIGILLAIGTAFFLQQKEIDLHSAYVLPICWNVLFLLILPLVLDYVEQKYLKIRFLEIDELNQNNPELKAHLDKQCQKLSITNIKLAIADNIDNSAFSYGLLGHNLRLILPSQAISSEEFLAKTIPSIETELSRFANQQITIYFIGFVLFQIVLEHIITQIF